MTLVYDPLGFTLYYLFISTLLFLQSLNEIVFMYKEMKLIQLLIALIVSFAINY